MRRSHAAFAMDCICLRRRGRGVVDDRIELGHLQLHSLLSLSRRSEADATGRISRKWSRGLVARHCVAVHCYSTWSEDLLVAAVVG